MFSRCFSFPSATGFQNKTFFSRFFSAEKYRLAGSPHHEQILPLGCRSVRRALLKVSGHNVIKYFTKISN
jgi:hypothetical protein